MTMPLMKPKRKNPVLRTRQMNLPPWSRGRVALGMTAAAAEGRFELQVCEQCQALQYPPREHEFSVRDLMRTVFQGAAEGVQGAVREHAQGGLQLIAPSLVK